MARAHMARYNPVSWVMSSLMMIMNTVMVQVHSSRDGHLTTSPHVHLEGSRRSRAELLSPKLPTDGNALSSFRAVLRLRVSPPFKLVQCFVRFPFPPKRRAMHPLVIRTGYLRTTEEILRKQKLKAG